MENSDFWQIIHGLEFANTWKGMVRVNCSRSICLPIQLGVQCLFPCRYLPGDALSFNLNCVSTVRCLDPEVFFEESHRDNCRLNKDNIKNKNFTCDYRKCKTHSVQRGHTRE